MEEEMQNKRPGATAELFETFLAHQLEFLFERIPFTQEFHEGKATDLEYYKRHLLETIIRIGMNNEVDAYCLSRIATIEKDLARELAAYLAQEFSHDDLFLTDLKQFGLQKSVVEETQPFFSTQLLMGYLRYSIEKDGALPTLIWSWFVEWYSKQYNLKIALRAKEEFGIEKVKGVLTHLQIDEDQCHAEKMFPLLEKLIKTQRDVEKVKSYLKNFVTLVGMYFQELYEETIAKPKNLLTKPSPQSNLKEKVHSRA